MRTPSLRVADVQRVLGVDERAHAARPLRLAIAWQRGRLPDDWGLDLDDAAARPADAERASRPTDPVGIVLISAMSPPDSGMIAPLPNCSMAAMALATAFNFSFMLTWLSPWSGRWLIDDAVLEGLGEVRGGDRRAARQVGDRARHAAYAGDGAG